MGYFMASVVVGLAILMIITVAICQVQLPCDSPLRPLPSLAIYFEHCNSSCRYNEWTQVIPHAGARPVSVPDSQCLSELALLGDRLQTPINPFECGETLCEICETRREEGFVCTSTCLYSNWTELTPLNNASLVTLLQSQCLSELAILGERFQQAISGYECTGTQCITCQDRREVGHICYSACNYSDWTGVNIINATPVAVPSFKCLSRLAIQGERLQRAVSGFDCTGTQCERCQDKREEIYVCNSICRYGNWTAFATITAVPIVVPSFQCLSELAILRERRQQAISGYECIGTQCVACQERREEIYICNSTCHYSNWTELIPLNNETPVMVPQTQCLSGLAILGERGQRAIGGYECLGTQCAACQDRREEIYICNSTCRYSNWTELALITVVPIVVPSFQCLSGLATLGERWQQAIGGYECSGTQCAACQDRKEKIYICNSTCRYSNWTELAIITVVPTVVPSFQCLSGLATLGERWQQAIGGYECTGTQCAACQARREEIYICNNTCRYSNWTELAIITVVPIVVPSFQCLSGLATLGERWQQAIGGYECTGTQCVPCHDRREELYICESTCNYSGWTELTPLNNATAVVVPESQCLSGSALPGERWQIAIGGYECSGTQCEECQDRREEIYICEPSIAERLIVLFELGNRGQDHHRYQTNNEFGSGFRFRRSSGAYPFPYDDEIDDEVCSSTQVCATQRRRRSIYIQQEVKGPRVTKQHSNPEPIPLPVDPIPFDIVKHSARYRRQNSGVNCYPNGTRYVLFLLDTSGSIGQDDFDIMTSTLSTLVHYFCRRIKIAALTFSDEHFIEFCFNCFDNDCSGRDNARDAMRDIQYRGGWTHTGQATQCACDIMLSPECGFPDITDIDGPGEICLDVIYVTDGHSNGPQNVCQKVQCLYDLGIELTVYAFGVANYNATELNCITRSDPKNNSIGNTIFRVQNFDQFAEAINDIGEVFAALESLPSIGNYRPPFISRTPTCFTTHSLDPDGVDTNDCSQRDKK